MQPWQGLLWYASVVPVLVRGHVTLCSEQTSQALQKKDTTCNGGVLFGTAAEISVSSLLRSGRKLCYVEDLCKGWSLQCDSKEPWVKAQYIVGNFTFHEGLQAIDDGGCKQLVEEAKIKSRKRRTTAGDSHILSKFHASPDLVDETHQMFTFLAGLAPEEVTADMESSKLLEDVFNVIIKRCDPTRLEPVFFKSINKAFLWLLSKYRSGSIDDFAAETASKIRRALLKCASNPHPIRVSGTDCLNKITYVSLQMADNGVEAAADYQPDDKFSFIWGLYDPVVDAVWLSIDTVHTLCAEYLNANGVLHDFSTFMIKLLTIEKMRERWRTPTPLRKQEIYDQIFLAPFNQSMAILDACNFAGTTVSNFGRSLRPRLAQTGSRLARRTRRSPIQSNVTTSICVHSEEEVRTAVEDLKKSFC